MDICSLDTCTGCGACCSVCPVQCIKMEEDDNGFFRPNIDKSKCIHCKLCQKTCPNNNIKASTNFQKGEIETYAFKNNNLKDLKNSSSGGAFSALSKIVIGLGGSVFGATYDEEFRIIHKSVSSYDDLSNLYGSKYVESDTKNTFSEVRGLLEKGKIVLYTGTPCQIAGLYASLKGRNYSNLYTVDILCHGVPSIKLFKEYLTILEESCGKIIEYNFRDKSIWGWGNWGCIKYLKDGKIKKKPFVVASDPFYSLYFKECNLRESCYTCKYATIPRVADITIGDFWGIQDILPNLDSKNGVSLILINNKHAKELILKDNSIVNNMVKLDINDAIKYNKTIIQSTHRPDSRNSFYEDFRLYGFNYVAKHYCKVKKYKMYLRFLLNIIPYKLKTRVKKLIRG